MDNWGLTEQGYYRPAYNEILDAYERRAKELFGSGINLTARSPLGIFLRIYAWVTGKLWQVSEDIYNAGYIDTGGRGLPLPPGRGHRPAPSLRRQGCG